LLLWMHQVMQYPFFFERLPVLADIFVFVYPIYLVVLYGYGMYYSWKLKTTDWNFFLGKFNIFWNWIPGGRPEWQTGYAFKESAIWVFVAAIVSMLFNMIVQVFLIKDRPDVVLDLLYQKKEDLILYDYLPQASFPSDHATMSMAIAIATLLYGLRYKKKWYVYFSVFLFAISLIMVYARVSIGIHRPTDIIGWYVVWILIPMILFTPKIYRWVKKYIIDRLVWVEEKIIGIFR